MLRSLYINNIAIISQLNLELHDGMTSITGETGAGKSIIIDSLALALGSRAEQNLLKHKTNKAEIIAEFDISHNTQALQWLEANEFDLDEPQCVLRRQLHQDKPSRSFINDRPVTVQLLRELGDLLANICGQQEHMNLIQANKRMEIVDAHANNKNALVALQNSYKDLTVINEEITQLQAADPIDNDQLNMISFLINELEQGNYTAENYQVLDEEQKRLAHATDIANAINTTINAIKSEETHSITDLLNDSINSLDTAKKYDQRLTSIIETLTEANVAVEDAASELVQLADKLEFDPEQLAVVEQELATYHDLARKHRCEPDELESKLSSLQQRLDSIGNRDAKLTNLKKQQKGLLDHYHKQAEEISMRRSKSSITLSKSITKHLKDLNLPNALVNIECKRDNSKISQSGQDNIRFLVSTNKGQPPGPIEKIASGGELSRISLAIQLEVNKLGKSSTLIFDEVDVGISGETADVVGHKLKALGDTGQVICITHLPQVASKAKHQLKISKQNKQAAVELNYLDTEDRIKELARFLSGKKITQESIANAKVMLQDST